ncbi:MAG: ABC transporter permease [Firmicutes bacterium]|nr:ABC transporter permease [Bacillota bacterium]
MRKLVNRLVISIIMIFVISSLTFFLVRLMPGTPYEMLYHNLLQKGMTEQQAMNQVRVVMDILPNQPLWQQYLMWVGQLLHGNLGQSLTETGVPVTELIFNALPWTLVTVSIGLIISFILGVLLGVISANNRDNLISSITDNIGSIAHAVPPFVTAIALLFLFTVVWHIFPSSGAYGIMETPGLNWPFISSFAYHMVLPVFTYVLTGFGAWELSMKSTTITVLKDDFMMAARIRGLPQEKIMSYLGWNSILPLFTGFMLSLGAMFGGSIFIETTYAFPGIGMLLGNAISNRDYPLMQGCFLVTTATVIFANVIADFVYSRLDPRISD